MRRGDETDRATQGEGHVKTQRECHVKSEAEIKSGGVYKPKNAKDCQ